MRQAIDDAVEGQDPADLLRVQAEATESDRRRVEDGLYGTKSYVDDRKECVISGRDDHAGNEELLDRERAGLVIDDDRFRGDSRDIRLKSGLLGRQSKQLTQRHWGPDSLGLRR